MQAHSPLDSALVSAEDDHGHKEPGDEEPSDEEGS